MAKLLFPKHHFKSCSKVSDDFPFEKLIFVYDGVCVLCSDGAKMVAKRDKYDRIRFVSGQSDLGKALFEHYNMPSTEFTAQLILHDGEAYTGFDGIAETVAQLPFSWLHLGRILRFFPFKERLYYLMARNRFRFFGKRSSCMIPPKELSDRFFA